MARHETRWRIATVALVAILWTGCALRPSGVESETEYVPTKSGGTPPSIEISQAVASGNIARVKALLATQAGLANAKLQNSRTPLHVAAESSRKEIAKLLLDSGANVRAKDRQGATPLHVAAAAGHLLLKLDVTLVYHTVLDLAGIAFLAAHLVALGPLVIWTHISLFDCHGTLHDNILRRGGTGCPDWTG